MPGKGRMSITGNLKDVMKESISAANSYVRARARPTSASSRRVFDKTDVHVHVPEGATPKDGPVGPGVAMATAMISVLTGNPYPQGRGHDRRDHPARPGAADSAVLKEKLLAALRSGITTVLIPKENEKDLADIPENVKAALEIVPVATVDEVLARALVAPADARSSGARRTRPIVQGRASPP